MEMTSKERILATMRGQKTDRVPFQLGLSNMFSVLQNGYRGWDIFMHDKAPMWKLVADTQRRFGLDGYLYLGAGVTTPNPNVQYDGYVVHSDGEKVVTRTIMKTPDGDLWSETVYMIDETPTVLRGFIKDEKDFRIWLKYAFYSTDYCCPELPMIKKYMGDGGVVAGSTGSVPGFHDIMLKIDGKLENTVYLYEDYPELFEEYVEKAHRAYLRRLEQMLNMGFDYIELSNSGMVTLANPSLFRKYSLPTIQAASKMIREAGQLSELHCCGYAKDVVQACHDQTDIDSINPLQEPPMGDCVLSEIKRLYGDTLCLKGNVGVTNPLLFGTPEDVERDVIRCMDAAKENGRFILFSEEGIGARTPVENVQAYVRAALRYGKY
jgi:uroporphyrinogen-III decarboxylase